LPSLTKTKFQSCKIVYAKDCDEDRVPKCMILPKRVCQEEDNDEDLVKVSDVKSLTKCQVEYVKECKADRKPLCQIVTKSCDSNNNNHTTVKPAEPILEDGENWIVSEEPQVVSNSAKEQLVHNIGCTLVFQKECTSVGHGREVCLPKEVLVCPKQNAVKEMPAQKEVKSVAQDCHVVTEKVCSSVGRGRQVCQDKDVLVCPSTSENTRTMLEPPTDHHQESAQEDLSSYCKTEIKHECNFVGRGRQVCEDKEITTCSDDPPKQDSFGSPLMSLIKQTANIPATRVPPKKVCPPTEKVCTGMEKQCGDKKYEPECTIEALEHCSVSALMNKLQVCHTVLNKVCRANTNLKVKDQKEMYGSNSLECKTKHTHVCNTHYILELQNTDRLSCLHVPRIECHPIPGIYLL
jgi:hypothetical protein